MTRILEEAWPVNAEQFSAVLERGEPVVFRGIANGWHLIASKDDAGNDPVERLAMLAGHRNVPVTVGLPEDKGVLGYGAMAGSRGYGNTYKAIKLLRDAIAEIKAEAKNATGVFRYIQSISVEDELPELLPWLELRLSECRAIRQGRWRLWLGSGDHHVGLHYDAENNFYCLLAGRKVFTTLDPSALPNVYVGPLEGGPFATPASIADISAASSQEFPRLREALKNATTFELFAGDVLFLPAYWWHQVSSFGVNLSVNYWWSDLTRTEAEAAHITFLRALLHLRPLPRNWRVAWRALFDYFVFQLSEIPYSYLAEENQGYAGSATEERVKQIRQWIRAYEGRAAKITAGLESLQFQDLKLAPSVVFSIAREEITIVNAYNQLQMTIPRRYMPIVLEFGSPCKAKDAVDAALRGDQSMTQAEAFHFVRYLFDKNILVSITSKTSNSAVSGE